MNRYDRTLMLLFEATEVTELKSVQVKTAAELKTFQIHIQFHIQHIIIHLGSLLASRVIVLHVIGNNLMKPYLG